MTDSESLEEKLSRFGLEIAERRSAGASDENLLAYLRSRGCSQMFTMQVLMRGLQMPLSGAKTLVLLSETWADVNSSGDQFGSSREDQGPDDGAIGLVHPPPMTNQQTFAITRAEPHERGLIEGLFQFYVYDFSEFEPTESDRFEVNAEARFDPYPMLDQYWRDEACIPLLIRVGDRLAGFALINAFAHSGQTTDRSMAEFFILRKYRRGGLGAAAVADILARYPGRWEIAVATRNAPAMAFWPRVVGSLDCVRDLNTLEMDEELWRGPVLRFVSSGRAA